MKNDKAKSVVILLIASALGLSLLVSQCRWIESVTPEQQVMSRPSKSR